MANQDIRWEQRLANYQKALSQLNNATELSKERKLSDLEQQGLIQAFEFTHELAWNVMKDYFEYQGNTAITGSRDASREAFQNGLIIDGDEWMGMIKSRNQSTHTYNQETMEEIVEKICSVYTDLFNSFLHKMKTFQSTQ
ncbi:MAG: nucleotidyltransferase [Bacteroidetes bacterium]|nr:MAG: nucleotidyltransferase [Bacteroidota bacterium]